MASKVVSRSKVTGGDRMRGLLIVTVLGLVCLILMASQAAGRKSNANNSSSQSVQSATSISDAASKQAALFDQACSVMPHGDDVRCLSASAQFSICANSVSDWPGYNSCALKFNLDVCQISFGKFASAEQQCENNARKEAPLGTR